MNFPSRFASESAREREMLRTPSFAAIRTKAARVTADTPRAAVTITPVIVAAVAGIRPAEVC